MFFYALGANNDSSFFFRLEKFMSVVFDRILRGSHNPAETDV